MNKSKDKDVQKFLDELQKFDTEKFAIVVAARKIVFDVCPNVSERIIYGGIMFTQSGDFGGLFVCKKHVSFEFSNGYQLKDPRGLLEGTGKFRRHLKLRNLNDVADKKVKFFVT